MDAPHALQVFSAHPALSWLIPYNQRVIMVPLDEATLKARLEACFARLASPPKAGWFTPSVRYTGTLSGEGFTLRGPIANKRFELLTVGHFRSGPCSSRIELTLQVPTSHLIYTAAIAVAMLIFMVTGRFPDAMIAIMIGFLYMSTTLSAKYEAEQTVQLLCEALATPPPPTAGTQQQAKITACGRGWICSACGGYVRYDASFCKHCKRPFGPRSVW